MYPTEGIVSKTTKFPQL